MKKIVGVRFKRLGKIYFFNPQYLMLRKDDLVIVDTEEGEEIGTVAIPNRTLEDEKIPKELKRVVRIANSRDLKFYEDCKRKEKEAYEYCQKKIKEYKLKMKLTDVEFKFNSTKALFYFTADGRIDFRELVKDLASKYNLKTISDLAKVSKDLTVSPTLEFVNRNDGLPGLLKAYNLEFKNTIAMDGSPRYTALLNNNSQVIDAFTTDGLLRKFNLTVLEDDKNFFPPYYAVPLLKQKTLEKYPEVETLMSKLGPYLTDEVMQEMNYQVDEVGKNPEEVAKEFLLANKLIEK